VGIEVTTSKDFKLAFEQTIKVADMINDQTEVTALPLVGIHPVELTKLKERFGLGVAKEMICSGLEIAAGLVQEGRAVGIKTGRPHYAVDDAVLEASNEIMFYGMKLAKEVGCAVQLHTESANQQGLIEISEMAREAGLVPEKVVKHFAGPEIITYENTGIFPSLISTKDAISTALSQGTRFMMETDYIDDLTRPGVVLGPKTVPRRTKQLIRQGVDEELFWVIHKDNPEKVYGVEINA
jgi:TatD-related deoxyribonuclease